MKRFLIAAMMFMLPFSTAFALYEVTESINQSSFTTTSDSIRLVCPTCGPGTELLNVSVSSVTGTVGAQCNIYDSSAVATSSISIVGLGTNQNPFFNIRVSSGLSYSCTSNTNGIAIIYRLRK